MELKEFKCVKCGGKLTENGALYQCEYCHAEFAVENLEKEKEALAQLLDEQKREKLSNLRRLLWTEIHEEYIDSEKIAELCGSIRKLSPDDFEARFFEVANSGSEAQINAFLRGVDFSDPNQKLWAEETVKFMLKSLRAKNLLAVQNLIERAFKDGDLEKYEKYSTVFSREAERVSKGVYEPSLPRDVFVMYSSKDMEKVESLVETLEEQGFTCFVAARNLQHGRGATANYGQALEKAMSACKTIVFVSSKYSRSMSCDAVRVEIPYFMEKDKENAPYQYRQRYDKMPMEYKKARVEYRLDNESSAENVIVKEFFGTLEYAYSKEEVAKRIGKYLTEEIAVTKEPKEEPNDEPKTEKTENKPPVVEKKTENKNASTKNELTKGVVREGNYIWFGEYPQSKKPANVTVYDGVDEDGYSRASDGCRYGKGKDGKHYKVEPIKWRILYEDGKEFKLLADKILDFSNKGVYMPGFGADNGNYVKITLKEMNKKLTSYANIRKGFPILLKTCECLGVEETKERLSRFKRIRKPTAFAQNNVNIKKEDKKVEMEGVNYWWADDKFIVTPFGSIRERKELYSVFYGKRNYAGTCWYGIVPCITIKILK